MSEHSVTQGTYRYLEEPSHYRDLVDRYDNFLFEALPGVVSVLEKLRKRNKRVLFVTNNASKSRATLLKRFKELGIQASENEVFSSASASALYLKEVLKFPSDRKVTLAELYVTMLTQDPKEHIKVEGTDFSPLLQHGAMDDGVAAVLCGIDTGMNYAKMAKAFRYLTRENATDAVQSIREASKRMPTVIGKPNQPMLDAILASHSFDRSRTLMVGDRLNTDIAFGTHGGLDTLLVLTGISKREEVHGDNPPAVPTYITNGLGDLDVLEP
ncbi:4-nitrophenylphosphatase [Malassezia brasiliensis]|uniref:4-nitrophenylphosphatase n=1 Tax=Malassezia brasiliensis TaxID=1821822 RepID=A0AAF0DTH2_9BASI|nr:4-nitrophenylphosphatase [Malassezia brasiliensis]